MAGRLQPGMETRVVCPPPLWYDRDFWVSGNNSVVECDLAKVEVAGSNPVSRSNLRSRLPTRVSFGWQARRRLSAEARSAKADC